MELLIIGDGSRDEAVIPTIVQAALGKEFSYRFEPWKGSALRLHRGTGFDRKLRLAIKIARAGEYCGIVATVDKDKDRNRHRLSLMQQVRSDDRANSTHVPLPTALGEANPHLESWLLDDGNAVKHVLQIDATESIPTIPHPNPKQVLDDLIHACSRPETPKHLLGEIAANLKLSQCQHKSQSGLEAFVNDVKQEFL